MSAGTYSIVVEDQFGCSVGTTETVVNNSGGFTASVTTVTDENCGDATDAIDITVIGGVSPYSFAWSNSASTEDISGLSAGTYDLVITDANGCNISLSAVVLNNTGTLAVTAITQDASCITPTGFIDLTVSGGTPGYTYAWSNAATSQDIAGLTAGTYTCQITDNAGCIYTYSGDINSGGGSITTTSVVSDAMCGNDNGSIEVTVNGGIDPYTFSWTGASPSPCCQYTLDMQDLFGDGWNGGELEVFINGSSIGTFSASGTGSTETIDVCDGDAIELNYTAGNWEEENVYTLLDASGNTVFTDGPNPATGSVYTGTTACSGGAPNTTAVYNLAAGNYSLTITDDVGCTLTENYTVLAVASDLQLNITSITDDNCLQGTGQVVYTVSGGTAPFDVTLNGVPDGGTPGQYSNEDAGTYDLVVWDANGCTDTLVVIIGNNTTFTTTVVSVVDENCGQSNGSIDIDVTGATVNFDWSNGETTEDITGLSAGTYTVTIQSFGPFCQDEQTFVIENIADIVVTGTSVDEFCGNAAGSIDLTVTGGTNLSFLWSNGATTEDLSGLSAGTYSCVVSNDDTGCEVTVSYDILNTTTGISVTGFANDDFCGNGNGSVDITVTGGSGNYSYAWSNGETTEDLAAVGQGDYSVTVTDTDDGCQTTFSVTVGNFATFDVTGIVTDAA